MDIQTTFNPLTGGFDWSVDGTGAIAMGNDLQTAIYLSLFSDARARPGDKLPNGVTDRRGSPIDIGGGYMLGSLLWLLKRQPRTSENLLRAKDYCKLALAWMVGDGVARAIDIVCEYEGSNRLGIWITVHKPDGTSEPFNFQWAWT